MEIRVCSRVGEAWVACDPLRVPGGALHDTVQPVLPVFLENRS
jgi:hypothetical protein